MCVHCKLNKRVLCTLYISDKVRYKPELFQGELFGWRMQRECSKLDEGEVKVQEVGVQEGLGGGGLVGEGLVGQGVGSGGLVGQGVRGGGLVGEGLWCRQCYGDVDRVVVLLMLILW